MANAIMMAGSTPPRFDESLVVKNERAWDGVGALRLFDRDGKPFGTCSGSLIADNAVLTAAHCFFGSNGVGPEQVKSAQFTLTGTPGSPSRAMKSRHIAPGYVSEPGHGHRVDGNDLAIVVLESPIADVPVYSFNVPQLIDSELGVAVILGYGFVGNGGTDTGHPGDARRHAINRVDWVQTAESMTIVRAWGQANRNALPDSCSRVNAGVCSYEPPADTLLIDFDAMDGKNATNLVDQVNGKDMPAVSERIRGVLLNEGVPAVGDSGGPMFQFLPSDTQRRHPILVGVTSSGSDAASLVGSLAYYTRVSAYQDWIDTVLEIPEPPSPLATLLAALWAARRLRRAPQPAGLRPNPSPRRRPPALTRRAGAAAGSR